MSQAQNLSWTKAQIASRLRLYRVLFLISILGNLVICLWCIFDPVGFARLLLQPDPHPLLAQLARTQIDLERSEPNHGHR